MALNPPHDEALQPVWNHACAIAFMQGVDVNSAEFGEIYTQFVALHDQRNLPNILPYEYPQVPGLVVRRALPSDIGLIEPVIIKGDNYTPEYVHKMLEQRLADPFCWCLVWEWQGQPIQFEALMLSHQDWVYIGYLAHFDRVRPQWFWRACEEPVWEWLKVFGYTELRSLIRKNRAFRIPRLQKVYNVVANGETDKFIKLKWDVNIPEPHGWPARRTAGPDWSFEYDTVSFREMKASEWPEVRGAVLAEFRRAGLRNGDTSVALLEDMYSLEHASVLLGIVDGKIKFVRAAREREPNEAAVANISPFENTRDARITSYVTMLWTQALGYTTATTFVPEAHHRSSKTQEYLKQVASYLTEREVFDHFDGPVHEYTVDLNKTLSSKTLIHWLAEYEINTAK